MSTQLRIAIPHDEPFRFWFLLSWLGLDAPCNVLIWTCAVSRSASLPLALRPATAMFLVVWSVYLSDRLYDVARCRDWSAATGRLRFGRRYRPLFAACLILALAGILSLLCTGLPVGVLLRASFVAVGVSIHFLLFVLPIIFRQKLPGKEFGVGLFFALGAFACLGATAQSITLFATIALLVAYNCLIIAARDAEHDRFNDPAAASRWWKSMPRDLLCTGVALTIALAIASLLPHTQRFFISAALSAALLTALHHASGRFSGDSIRALADFALFTPLLTLALR